MSINLQKEHIKISEILCSKYFQTTVESDVIVPDVNPDILKILQIESNVFINRKEAQNNKISLHGIIQTNILYIPDGDVLGKVKSITTSRDFSHAIDISGVTPEMNLSVDAECENPEYAVLNSRKLSIRNKIGFAVKVTVPSEVDVATDILGDEAVQIKSSHIQLYNSCTETEQNISICERLEVPTGNPDLGEILKVSVKPAVSELRLTENKAIVKGDVKICVLYNGNDENCNVHFMEHTLPFTEIPEFNGLTEKMTGEIDFSVKNLSFEICEDSDGDPRILNVDITLCAIIKASETIELNAISDAYGIKNDIIIKRSNHNLEHLIENTVAHCPLKEQITVSDHMPEIQQICEFTATPAIENISVDNGKITVTGFANCNILYLSPSEDSSIASLVHTIPFSHTFEIPGIGPHSVCDAKSDIEHLAYNIISDRILELRMVISVGLKAINPWRAEIVDSIEWDNDSIPIIPPAMIIYFVQEGDSLWDIAKRYKTTPDHILADNNCSENELMKPGNRIHIFRNN